MNVSNANAAAAESSLTLYATESIYCNFRKTVLNVILFSCWLDNRNLFCGSWISDSHYTDKG